MQTTTLSAAAEAFLSKCAELAKGTFSEGGRNFYDPHGGDLRNWGEAEFWVDEAEFDRFAAETEGLLDVVGTASKLLVSFTKEGYERMRGRGKSFTVEHFHKNGMYAPFLDKPVDAFRRHLESLGLPPRSVSAHVAHMTRRQRREKQA